MILASNAPSPPQSHDNEEEEEEKEDGDEGGEGEGGGYGTTEASPHAQLMRLLLRAVDGGPEARAVLVDLVDARNRNGKTGESGGAYVWCMCMANGCPSNTRGVGCGMILSFPLVRGN